MCLGKVIVVLIQLLKCDRCDGVNNGNVTGNGLHFGRRDWNSNSLAVGCRAATASGQEKRCQNQALNKSILSAGTGPLLAVESICLGFLAVFHEDSFCYTRGKFVSR